MEIFDKLLGRKHTQGVSQHVNGKHVVPLEKSDVFISIDNKVDYKTVSVLL